MSKKVFIEVNQSTIDKGDSQLLMCEAKDYLESQESILDILVRDVEEIKAFLVL